jgi:hypothetical protein
MIVVYFDAEIRRSTALPSLSRVPRAPFRSYAGTRSSARSIPGSTTPATTIEFMHRKPLTMEGRVGGLRPLQQCNCGPLPRPVRLWIFCSDSNRIEVLDRKRTIGFNRR